MAKYKIIPSSMTIVRSPISIGHKAEKGVEAIEFDVTAWVETYGSGTLTVIMRRWGDAIPYPIALEIDENNKATWTLSDIDTAKAGMAYAQLNYIVGDEVVKKSDIYTFRVMDSLTGEGEPPEAYESWLEHLTHLAAEAMAEVLDIEGIVTDKTLTVAGGIADAKATGDALSALEDQFTEKTDKLKADLGAHENYTKTKIGSADFEIADITGYTEYNGALGSAGTWSNATNANYKVIAIPVTGGHISFSCPSNSPTNVTYAGVSDFSAPSNGVSYNATESFGRKVCSAGNSSSYDIPSDVKYIVINVLWGGNAPIINNFLITQPGTTGQLEADINAVTDAVYVPAKNMVNPAEIESGYISANGTVFSSDSYKTTGFINIKNNEPITISPKGRQFAVFNTSKVALLEKFVDLSGISTPYTYTPTNDGYIRVSFFANDINIIQIEYGERATAYASYSNPKPVNDIVVNMRKTVNNFVKGTHSILVIGDSYSYNTDRYIKYLQEHISISNLVNLGVSSAKLKDLYEDRTEYPYDGRPISGGVGNNNTFGNQIAKLQRLMAGVDLDSGETQIYTDTDDYPDIILIEGGKNDIADQSDDYESEMWTAVTGYSYVAGGGVSNTPISTYIPVDYENTNRTNFGGAMHYLYGALHNLFPNASIFFITPSGINYANANHTAYMTKSEQIRKAARFLCTPTIDWDIEGRLTYVDNVVTGSGTQEDPYTRSASSEYTIDSLHPNRKGGDLLGAVVCAKLREYGLIN